MNFQLSGLSAKPSISASRPSFYNRPQQLPGTGQDSVSISAVRFGNGDAAAFSEFFTLAEKHLSEALRDPNTRHGSTTTGKLFTLLNHQMHQSLGDGSLKPPPDDATRIKIAREMIADIARTGSNKPYDMDFELIRPLPNQREVTMTFKISGGRQQINLAFSKQGQWDGEVNYLRNTQKFYGPIREQLSFENYRETPDSLPKNEEYSTKNISDEGSTRRLNQFFEFHKKETRDFCSRLIQEIFSSPSPQVGQALESLGQVETSLGKLQNTELKQPLGRQERVLLQRQLTAIAEAVQALREKYSASVQ